MRLLGIKKIEYCDSRNLYDYSQLAPGSTINLTTYLKEGCSFSELPFTAETADLSEQWLDDEGGQHSQVAFSASIRKDKELYRSLLNRLRGRKAVWKVTLVEGKVYVIGSPQFVPTFTWSDGVSGLSSSEFTVSIDNDSTHGILLHSA